MRLLIATVVALSLILGTTERAGGENHWRELIDQYQWDGAKAEAVMLCESDGNADAYNPVGPYWGLFQIWEGHRWTAEELVIPEINVAAAYEKYRGMGWQPWPECGLGEIMILPGSGHGPMEE